VKKLRLFRDFFKANLINFEFALVKKKYYHCMQQMQRRVSSQSISNRENLGLSKKVTAVDCS
jgi:hypothetical protein